MSLEDWLAKGALRTHKPSARGLQDLLVLADRGLADARVKGLSAEGRYQIASRACLKSGAARVVCYRRRALQWLAPSNTKRQPDEPRTSPGRGRRPAVRAALCGVEPGISGQTHTPRRPHPCGGRRRSGGAPSRAEDERSARPAGRGREPSEYGSGCRSGGGGKRGVEGKRGD